MCIAGGWAAAAGTEAQGSAGQSGLRFCSAGDQRPAKGAEPGVTGWDLHLTSGCCTELRLGGVGSHKTTDPREEGGSATGARRGGDSDQV